MKKNISKKTVIKMPFSSFLHHYPAFSKSELLNRVCSCETTLSIEGYTYKDIIKKYEEAFNDKKILGIGRIGDNVCLIFDGVISPVYGRRHIPMKHYEEMSFTDEAIKSLKSIL